MDQGSGFGRISGVGLLAALCAAALLAWPLSDAADGKKTKKSNAVGAV